MFIRKLKEEEATEKHFVEAQIMRKDTREENVVEAKEQLSIEV